MTKRLEMLEKMVDSGAADSFARYALAMEYRRHGRFDDALSAFDELRAADPDYVPMYLMAGQLLTEHDQSDAARQWLQAGLEKARAAGDSKATSEIEDALAAL